jgi:hypothetical protein
MMQSGRIVWAQDQIYSSCVPTRDVPTPSRNIDVALHRAPRPVPFERLSGLASVR